MLPRRQPPIPQSHAIALVVFSLGILGHQTLIWDWFIEDSAITFAYARNWVAGEGLVPWAGGERIEGYSNPLWMVLIALGELVGLTGFQTAKPLAVLCSIVAMLCTYGVSRHLLDDEEPHAALIPPAILALTSQFNMWAGSGLENSLFGAFLAAAIWRQTHEMDTGARPWSSLLFVGLSLTRPEGILYAAVGGAWFAWYAIRDGRGFKPILAWFVGFWGPYLAFVALRLWYFAWPLPMTYYAKVGTGGTVMHKWYGRGWLQAREYAQNLLQGWFIPIYLAGLFGTRTPRAVRWVIGMSAAYALMMLVPGPTVLQDSGIWPSLPEPQWWIRSRIVLGMGGAFLLAFVASRGPRTAGRVLCWSMVFVSVFFAVYSNGDWMRGFRWFSLLGPPTAVLFGLGSWDIGRHAAQRFGASAQAAWIPVAVLSALYAVPNVQNTLWFMKDGKNESPGIIKRRVEFTQSVGQRLFLDEQIRNLDMDMGAFLWWSDQWPVDMAGLVDVPIALHTYADRAFIQEYVLQERRPHMAHVHGHWERTSEFTAYTDFKAHWFEMPPWKDGRVRLHPGEYLRRDLVFQPQWTGSEDRRVDFAGGVSIQGWNIPAESLSRGRAFYVEVGVKTWARDAGDTFQVLMFLSNGKQLATWELPLAYDWLPTHKWRPDETFIGKYWLELPGHLEVGDYEVGFVALNAKGRPFPAGGWQSEARVAPSATVHTEDARLFRGEVRFSDPIHIEKYPKADEHAQRFRQSALELAETGDCEAAEAMWTRSWQAMPRHTGWRAETREALKGAMAHCWTQRSVSEPDQRLGHLERARSWDYRNPKFLAEAEQAADALYAEGMAHRDNQAWDDAYLAFSAVLRIAPHRAWARRRAEEARNERLGLGPIKLLGRVQRSGKREPAP